MKAKLPKTTMKAEVKGTGIQDVEKGRQMIGYKIKGEIRTRTPFGEKVTTIKPAEKSMIQLSQKYPGTWKSEPYTLKGVSGEVMKYPKGGMKMQNPEAKRKNEENRTWKLHKQFVKKFFYLISGLILKEKTSSNIRNQLYLNTKNLSEKEKKDYIEEFFLQKIST